MTQAEAATELLRRRNARKDLSSFTTYIHPEYKPAWFHLYMADRLTRFIKGEIKRLIIEMPPGYAKSEYVSRHAPAFAFGINPDDKIIACSYGANLASAMNRDVQRIMTSEEYRRVFPDTLLGGSNVVALAGKPLRNSEQFDVGQKLPNGDERWKGYYKNAGVGGAITGRRFRMGFIDDFIKGAEEAQSALILEKIWNWYKTDFYSRAYPDAGICICATRWAEDDLIGQLLRLAKEDPNADQWEVIKFQHYVEDGDELPPYDKRQPGELLWPERYGMDNYLATRSMYDAYQYSALYQQNPTAREGNVIKRSWYEPYQPFLDLSTITDRCIYFDLGASDNIKADETAGSVKVRTSDNTFVTLWQLGGRWSPDERNLQIEQFCITWNRIFPGIPVWLESGIGLGYKGVEDLRNALIAKGVNAHLDAVKESKYTRATAQKDSYMAACEAHRTKFYTGNQFKEDGFYDGAGTWIPAYFNEVLKLQFKQTSSGIEFVGGHDDRLDAETGAHNKLTAGPSTAILGFF